MSVLGLDPAGRLVGGVVADECVGDAVGTMGQRAGDDAAGLAAIFECVGVVLGGLFVEPQADTEVDQGATQRNAAFSVDSAVARLCADSYCIGDNPDAR